MESDIFSYTSITEMEKTNSKEAEDYNLMIRMYRNKLRVIRIQKIIHIFKIDI